MNRLNDLDLETPNLQRFLTTFNLNRFERPEIVGGQYRVDDNFAGQGFRTQTGRNIHRIADDRKVTAIFRSNGTRYDLAAKHPDANVPGKIAKSHGIDDFQSRRDASFTAVFAIETGKQGVTDHFINIAVMPGDRLYLQGHQPIEKTDHDFRGMFFGKTGEAADVGIGGEQHPAFQIINLEFAQILFLRLADEGGDQNVCG